MSEGDVNMENEFIECLVKVGPLFYVALILSFIFSWSKIKQSFRCDHPIAWFFQYIVASIATAVLAVATTFLIPLVFPDGVSSEVKLGITCYICVFGVKALDGIARKKFGFSIVDDKGESNG